MDAARMSREEVQSVVFRYSSYCKLRRIASLTSSPPPPVNRERFLLSAAQAAA